MKVIIVDDEPNMIFTMSRLLSHFKNVEIVATFEKTDGILEFIHTNEVNLAFLDIEIGMSSGIELAKHIRNIQDKLEIVFTTSHSSYAIEAFNVYALDYMVKPVTKKRLEQTLKRITERINASFENERSNFKHHIYCFGNFDVTTNRGISVKWISKKSTELLAYLLLNSPKSVSKTQIIETLFSSMSISNPEVYLNTIVYQLRKALNQLDINDVILSHNNQYRIDLKHFHVDFIEFEKAIEQLIEINDKNEKQAIATENLYTDYLFGEKAYEWAIVEREQLAIKYEIFSKKLITWLINNHKLRESLLIVKKIISYNEFDEEAYLLLFKILIELKDREAVIHYYKQYEQLLSVELGINPPKNIKEFLIKEMQIVL